jgi:hypothetical protein
MTVAPTAKITNPTPQACQSCQPVLSDRQLPAKGAITLTHPGCAELNVLFPRKPSEMSARRSAAHKKFTPMKAGRPSYHIPSKWVTVSTPQGIVYYLLDDKGNLVRGEDKQFHPDHIAPLTLPPGPPPQLPRARKARKPPPPPVVSPPQLPVPELEETRGPADLDQPFESELGMWPELSEFPDDFNFHF